jgi:YHS domain-containing protein
MISAFIREFVLPLIFFLFLRSLLSGFFSGRRSPSRTPNATPPPPAASGGKLYKDPVCGTYVSGDSAITLTMNGRTMYFCSRECWDKYRAE